MFEVHYYYYQYNSGMGDNGCRSAVREFKLLEDAEKCYKEIEAARKDWVVDEELSEGTISEETRDTILKYIPTDGYFHQKPKLYQVTRTEIEVK